MVMAAVMTASPAFACADFCPESQAPASTAAADDHDAGASVGPMAAMHEGCEDGGTSLPSPTTSHDEDCTGCPDCSGAVAVKKQALAAAAAVSVEAPKVVVLSGPFAVFSRAPTAPRWRLKPPAVGPPLASTPISLKNILRI